MSYGWGADTICTFAGYRVGARGTAAASCIDYWPPAVERMARHQGSPHGSLHGVASCDPAAGPGYSRIPRRAIVEVRDAARPAGGGARTTIRVACADTISARHPPRHPIELSPLAMKDLWGRSRNGRVEYDVIGRDNRLVLRSSRGPAAPAFPDRYRPSHYDCLARGCFQSGRVRPRLNLPVRDIGSPYAHLGARRRRRMHRLFRPVRSQRDLWKADARARIRAAHLNLGRARRFEDLIRAFQRAEGLRQTGLIEAPTAARLGYAATPPWWVHGARLWLNHIAIQLRRRGISRNVTGRRLLRFSRRFNVTRALKHRLFNVAKRPWPRCASQSSACKRRWGRWWRQEKPKYRLDARSRQALGGVPPLYWWMGGWPPRPH